MEGTYSFVYSSAAGVGVGVFKVTGSNLVGADLSGGRYKGTVTTDAATGEIKAEFDMRIPAGIGLVQGTTPLDMASSRRVTVTLPRNYGDGEPQKLAIPPGHVWAIIVRVPDDPWAAYAAGMTVSVIPSSS